MTAVEDGTTEAPVTPEDHLRVITEANDRLEAAQQDLHDAVWAARHATPKPVTWDKIGAAIGITRQGATERFTPRRRRRR
jgi:hypothetical protein